MITIYTIKEDTTGVITKDDFVLGNTQVVNTEWNQKYSSDDLVVSYGKHVTFKYDTDQWITFEWGDVEVEHFNQ